ncbi:hypothetical protein ASE48_31435 [Mycobacterium sp. Root265]|uniref:hypothetical protein n=1 Tax=Mycobacterium sp. Root265 TaxID=1736504 RepID=UPI00070FBDD1|nr:hypothetical protein [Mycobacterium sp. Root265]KRD12009.1 hypothetical protein ASE48_31435 [Mycobacterium sp. Root265]
MQKHRTTTVGVLTIVGALLCAAAIGGFLLYRFHLLRPYVFHPLLFGVTGGLALALACGLGLRRPLARWIGVAVCVLGAAAIGFIGWFASAFQTDLTAESRLESADGSMELVVYSGSAVMAPDPIWELRLHTRQGLLSQERDLGCVNADVLSLNGIGWTGPRTLRVALSSGVVDIAVDGDGRPDRTVDGGC